MKFSRENLNFQKELQNAEESPHGPFFQIKITKKTRKSTGIFRFS